MKSLIDAELSKFFDEQKFGYDEYTDSLVQELKDFVLSDGKRLRPTLLLLTMAGYGKQINNDAINASVAVELLHDFLLVHDDIIDNSQLRRKKPTLHSAIKSKTIFNKETAIILGDLLFSLCFKALNKISSQYKSRVFEVFMDAVNTTCIGQLQDIHLSELKIKDVSEDIIMKFNSIKTCSYTVEMPMKIGAILADVEYFDQIESIARPLGKAFQIKDDLIGLFGYEDQIGKPVKSDIEEGKKTLPLVVAYQDAGTDDRDFIDTHIGKKITDKDLETIKRIVEENNAKEYTEKIIDELVELGNNAIMNSHLNNKEQFLDISAKWFR